MPTSPPHEWRQRLIDRFRRQVAFAVGYSPLYACLFETLAGWLEADEAAGAWLLQAGAGRDAFDVPLLLAAGLHRDVLAGEPATAALATFYPTVGGVRLPEATALGPALRAAILARREGLAAFIQSAHVQTNETGRGLVWLLPILGAGWGGVHLVDIGASAGLNLAAEARAYRLLTTADRPILDVGAGQPVQFQVRCAGALEVLTGGACPPVMSRLGCDIAPFHLDSAENERTLAAFIWGDQPQRLQRLREGIDAYRRLAQTPAPVRLFPVRLPDELPAFLSHVVAPQIQADRWPLVIYNTWMRNYLPDKGQSLRASLGGWAQEQARPVIWLQWEPPEADELPPPLPDWCVLSAETWQPSPQRWRLGCVHPHGTQLSLEPAWRDWARFGRGLA